MQVAANLSKVAVTLKTALAVTVNLKTVAARQTDDIVKHEIFKTIGIYICFK
jgi:hypothetical protein